MKNIILLAIALFSINAMASDISLNCYDKKDNLVTSSKVKDGIAKIEFNDMSTDKYSVAAKFDANTQIFNYTVYEMNSGLSMEEDEFPLNLNTQVRFVSGYYCVLEK